MTFEQYIQNPMGTGVSVVTNREMYRKMYTEKFDKILIREIDNINRLKEDLFIDGDRYIAHIKVPSETVPNFWYDVVIEFTEPKKKDLKEKVAHHIDSTLKNYEVRFFANDPAFMFTFAHTFAKRDLFFKDLASKMPKKALKERAVQKNPYDIVGYVKSLYFAYLIMERKGLWTRALYCKTYKKAALEHNVVEADLMLARREEEGKKHANAEKAEKKRKEEVKKAADKASRNDVRMLHNRTAATGVGNTKVTPVIKPIKNGKVGNFVKKVNTKPLVGKKK